MSENLKENKTLQYIYRHKAKVQKWLNLFAAVLNKRGLNHDNSKLESPEYQGWVKMDNEPRYDYGTKEYDDKIERYKWLLKEHYSKNRHHPEYWDLHKEDTSKDLIDIIEMLCDWLGYRDQISYKEASDLVKKQTERYGFSEELSDLILNTLTNNFIDFGYISKYNKEFRKSEFETSSANLLDLQA